MEHSDNGSGECSVYFLIYLQYMLLQVLPFVLHSVQANLRTMAYVIDYLVVAGPVLLNYLCL